MSHFTGWVGEDEGSVVRVRAAGGGGLALGCFNPWKQANGLAHFLPVSDDHRVPGLGGGLTNREQRPALNFLEGFDFDALDLA